MDEQCPVTYGPNGFLILYCKSIYQNNSANTGGSSSSSIVVEVVVESNFVSELHLIRLLLYGPRQANLVLIAYASSEGSGEPAHPRSLARTSSARS